MAFITHSSAKYAPFPVRRASLFDLIALYRQRRALVQLDDAALEDLGLSRKDAAAEARRPFWDVPTQWTA